MIKSTLFLIITLCLYCTYGFPFPTDPCTTAIFEIIGFQYPNASEMIEYNGLKLNDLGNYDGCISLPSNVSQYCVYQNSLVSGTVAFQYYIGVCYPSICSPEEIKSIIPNYTLSAPANLSTAVIHCYNNDEQTAKIIPSTGAIVLFVLSGIIVLFIVLGSLIDYIYYYRISMQKKRDRNYNSGQTSEHVSLLLNDGLDSVSDTTNSFGDDKEFPPCILDKEFIKFFSPESPPIIIQVLLCFSLIKNYHSFIAVRSTPPQQTKSSLSTQSSASTTQYFDSLDGIRTLSMAWVVLGHSLLFNMLVGYDNISTVFQAYQGFAFQLIPAGEFAVDIFFMLSGFLVCYTVLQQFQKYSDQSVLGNIKFWTMYVVHRFVRLSPLYYFVLFVYIYIGPIITNGPLSYVYELNEIAPLCSNSSWYTNLIYWNNMASSTTGSECFPVSWYLANDMQFFVFSILIFIIYRKNRLASWLFMSLVLLGSFIISWVVTVKYDIKPFFDLQSNLPSGVSLMLTDIYEKPWFRIGPYLVGLACGFLYHDHLTTLKKIYRHWILRYLIFTVSLGITTILTFTPYNAWVGVGWNNTQNALWNAFAHTMFTVGIAGYMFGSFFGYGALLKWFLELPIFKLLSKLTYATYLCHTIVVYIRISNTTALFHYSWTEYAYTYIGNLVCSMSVAFILHLTIEKPFINLERLIFKK